MARTHSRRSRERSDAIRPAAPRRAAPVAFALAVFIGVAAYGATPAAGFTDATAPPLTAFERHLLAKYQAAIANFVKPPNMIFTYTESRGGPDRVVTGTHRVYRDASGFQRNETLEINGSALQPPHVQTFARPVWPYHADRFTVDPAEYVVKFAGIATVGGRRAYVFDVTRSTAAPFEISELALDPASGLPLRERYSVNTAECSGRGEIEFAAVGSYWLPSSVWAQCEAPGGKSVLYRDSIKFANYTFPAAIPKEILNPSGGGQ